MLRVGLFKSVHVKTPLSQRIRVLLTTRKFLQHKVQDTQNIIRSMMQNFGIKVGLATRLNFHQRVIKLLEPLPDLRVLVGPLLEAHRILLEQYNMVHKTMKLVAKDDEVCQLLMTAPGVGSLVALSFRAGVDEPARFARSRSVPVHFGLTPRRHQSGEKDRMGAISKFGDASVRWALFEGANALLLVSKKSSPLKEWGLAIAKRRGVRKAVTAVARRLAVILHRMWVEQTPYRWDAKVA
jgi:transposase